jgi:hypothetical protein
MLMVGRELSRPSAEPWSDQRGGACSVGSTGLWAHTPDVPLWGVGPATRATAATGES